MSRFVMASTSARFRPMPGQMLVTRRSMRSAGASAHQRFETVVTAWRRRVLRRFLLVCCLLFVAFTAAGALIEGQGKFVLGMLAGATMAFYVALRESPPWHIEKWRMGEEGERLTAKALRTLPRPEWTTWHDLPGAHRTNLDHVVVGPAGVFLLDSKNFSGEGRIEGGELRVRWIDDPQDGWVCKGMASRMRAASAELKERIEAATRVRVWVQPVVVLWMPFPQGVVQSSDVFFVRGDALVEWLATRANSNRSFDVGKVAALLDDPRRLLPRGTDPSTPQRV